MPRKVRILVNEDKCYLCGGCAGVCPALAIRVGSKWEFSGDKCISCMICVKACPVGALTAEEVSG
ncbi:DUF362 domain-containing protein [Pyrococcus yayanosii]|uniref:Ferredoxin 2 n=1 Tax=Pyrococcus yayanosii (strain CH1 / JCM 16557) TaxID=529709 RepID=F8AH68_PYRYC|nr:4Fe-4S binding protein [Pyrococcus yayanosii]AEH25298.1 ferredoxin 2 [Pyrococcus yayanosii CH1]